MRDSLRSPALASVDTSHHQCRAIVNRDSLITIDETGFYRNP